MDWLCFPSFDSPSVFSRILGTEEHGRWLLAPSEADAAVVDRRYIDSTFVLQTIWKTGSGSVLVTDFMPLGDSGSSLVHRVTGVEGSLEMRHCGKAMPPSCSAAGIPTARRLGPGACGRGQWGARLPVDWNASGRVPVLHGGSPQSRLAEPRFEPGPRRPGSGPRARTYRRTCVGDGSGGAASPQRSVRTDRR
ncbi:trehalase-like domain-containing protein [Arthrobacter ginsengisoli]|uniref:trehalase-like domain-containing protein n=1 Tax=Arthrobacter ginsengisoli TaxID=1356565 RepID=UPI00286CA731|nr:trehalase-like domain-containing protein [Arthrobacter ginsengisoli]